MILICQAHPERPKKTQIKHVFHSLQALWIRHYGLAIGVYHGGPCFEVLNDCQHLLQKFKKKYHYCSWINMNIYSPNLYKLNKTLFKDFCVLLPLHWTFIIPRVSNNYNMSPKFTDLRSLGLTATNKKT